MTKGVILLRKIASRSILGLLLIAVGIGYLAKHLGYWPEFTIFFDGWWAILFLVLPAVLSIISDGFNQGNIILGLVGVILFLSQFKVFGETSAWEIILCAILIVIGIGIIFKPAVRPKKKDNTHYVSGSTAEKQSVAFASSTFRFDGRTFDGGNYSVSFGELILDLRGAVIEHDCELAIQVAFGSMEILLPENMVLVNNTGSFFGGVEIKRRGTPDPNYPKIILTGNCAFGGVEIK